MGTLLEGNQLKIQFKWVNWIVRALYLKKGITDKRNSSDGAKQFCWVKSSKTKKEYTHYDSTYIKF